MKIVKWLTMLVLAFVALFVVIGLLLPSRFNVQRSVVINAESAKIHVMVSDLARWDDWEPWTERDPTLTTTIPAASTGAGAMQRWEGKDGSGELKITRSDVRTGVAYAMFFNEGDLPSIGKITYGILDDGATPADSGTLVTWNWSGELGMNPLMRWYGAMLDQEFGPIFQRGLDTLKEQVESMPDPMTEPGEMMEEGTDAATEGEIG